jgi:hypothetical protein
LKEGVEHIWRNVLFTKEEKKITASMKIYEETWHISLVYL